MAHGNDVYSELREQVAVHEARINATERANERLADSIDNMRTEFVKAIQDLNSTIVKVVGAAIVGLIVERLLS